MCLQECCSIADKRRDLYRAATADFETIGSIAGLEAVAEGSAWQDFERLAAWIFEQNGFGVSVGTVKTRHRQRRQYDVIATRNGRTLLVECKQWSGSRYRLSALKKAILQHRERTAFYERILQVDAVPVIVTLIEEEVLVYEGVPIVPVHRLNAFIGELDRFSDGFPCAEITESEEEEAGEFPGISPSGIPR